MTSQVAVGNLLGFAVASDTVVTQSSAEGLKTLENMTKIYPLGSNHKVVILHSGRSAINDVSHWLHVTEWASSLTAPLPTLQDYVDAYIAWSNRARKLHSERSEVVLMNDIFNNHFYYIKNRADEELNETLSNLSEGESLTDEYIAAVILQFAKEGLEHLESLEEYDRLTIEECRAAIKAGEFDLKEKIEFIFKDFVLTEELQEILLGSAPLLLLKRQNMDDDSELGFVGFGSEEPFGGVIDLKCRGFYAGKLMAFNEPRFAVAPYGSEDGSTSIIRHFAQGDAIYAFIRGFHWKILSHTLRTFKEKVDNLLGGSTFELPGDSEGEAGVTRGIEEITDEISDQTYELIRGDYSQENFASPLLSSITGMSVLNLANFAQSLVGIQALSTYSQRGTATVGGFIEVVTIDRSQGVVWRNRLDTA